MKIKVKCKECGANIFFKSFVNDRIELAKLKGDNFVLQCNNCNRINKYHVNETEAYINNKFEFVFLLISLLFIFGTGYYLMKTYWNRAPIIIPVGLFIPVLIYSTYIRSCNKKKREYNRIKR